MSTECGHKGPDGCVCERNAGHSDSLHRQYRLVRSTPYESDYKIMEWNDAGEWVEPPQKQVMP